jgi:hypothetical protein
MADDITQVRIGKNLIGLRGLTEIFQELASRSWESPAAAQEELLRRAAGGEGLAKTTKPRTPGTKIVQRYLSLKATIE